MKRALIILMLVLCIAGTANAQRCLKGMQGIQLTGGMADGFHADVQSNKLGYYFGAALTTYGKSADKWVFGGEYLQRYYPYRETRIPMTQFTAEGGYFYNFLSDGSKTLFCSIGGSVLAGYETSNRGKKILFDGSLLQNRDRFLLGGAITLEVEIYLTDRIVLLLTGRERVLSGSDTGLFHSQVGLGVRFMIN